ncbi:hypothetical protein, partial [Sabulibacter ruber]|uniref:hypothetical protein n=1 Tax=Sabulibacter ruber TaxID=2811901 RepID=UPI001A96F115
GGGGHTHPRLPARAVQVTSRVAELLTPENQRAISETLENSRVLTAELAKAAAGLEGTMARLNSVMARIEVAAPSVQESMVSMA